MICVLCKSELPEGTDEFSNIDAAIDAGWIPSFWVEEEEYYCVCPVCTEKYLQQGPDGEFELKPELVSTFTASASARLDLVLEIESESAIGQEEEEYCPSPPDHWEI